MWGGGRPPEASPPPCRGSGSHPVPARWGEGLPSGTPSLKGLKPPPPTLNIREQAGPTAGHCPHSRDREDFYLLLHRPARRENQEWLHSLDLIGRSEGFIIAYAMLGGAVQQSRATTTD